MSFNVHNDRRSLCSDRRSFLNTAGGLGRCKLPKRVQGRALVQVQVQVQGAKPPEALRTLHFTVPEKRLKTGLKALSYYGAFLPVL